MTIDQNKHQNLVDSVRNHANDAEQRRTNERILATDIKALYPKDHTLNFYDQREYGEGWVIDFRNGEVADCKDKKFFYNSTENQTVVVDLFASLYTPAEYGPDSVSVDIEKTIQELRYWEQDVQEGDPPGMPLELNLYYEVEVINGKVDNGNTEEISSEVGGITVIEKSLAGRFTVLINQTSRQPLQEPIVYSGYDDNYAQIAISAQGLQNFIAVVEGATEEINTRTTEIEVITLPYQPSINK